MNIMADNIKDFLANLFKKKSTRIFLSIVALLLVVSAVLQALTPPPVPIETIVTNTQKYSPKIVFNQISIEIPKKITVYRNLEDKSSKADDLVQQFVKNLQLVKKSTLPYWRNEEATILLEKSSNNDISIAFYNKDGLIPKTGITERKDLALENIQDLLIKLGMTENTVISDPQYMLMDNHIVAAPNKEAANAMLFKVSVLLDGFPLISGDTAEPPAEFWTDLEGNIKKASFYPIGKTFEKVETHNTLSLDQIEQQVTFKNVTFINVSSREDFESYTDTLREVTFDKALLEYRKNEQNGYIVPYIRFVGIGFAGSESFDVEAISPAVKVE